MSTERLKMHCRRIKTEKRKTRCIEFEQKNRNNA